MHFCRRGAGVERRIARSTRLLFQRFHITLENGRTLFRCHEAAQAEALRVRCDKGRQQRKPLADGDARAKLQRETVLEGGKRMKGSESMHHMVDTRTCKPAWYHTRTHARADTLTHKPHEGKLSVSFRLSLGPKSGVCMHVRTRSRCS